MLRRPQFWSVMMSTKVCWVCYFLLLFLKSASPNDPNRNKIAGDDEITHNKCENITVNLCKDVGYSQTIVPNLIGNRNQKEADSDLQRFSHLISSKCSPFIKLFLCSVYVPVCTSLEHALPPCRSLCLLAKDGCEQFMKRFGFSWPEILRCDKFDNLQPCIETNQENFWQNENQIINDPPVMFRTSKELDYKIFLGPSVMVENCGIPCNDAFMFLGDEQSSARIFVGLFSCFCLVSSLFTVSTFLVDRKRFVYPQRPFVFVATCHAFVCLVYVVGFASRGRIACTEAFPENEASTQSPVAVQGSHKGLCSVTFAFTYYFQMTGHLWWIGLNLAWLMSACLKWSQEAITRNSKYLHAVIWILPAVQTAVVMFLARLEGDPVVGVCSLVEPNQVKLFLFVPLVFFSVLGSFCWSAGLVGLNKVRTAVRSEGVCPKKLNKLMIRVGVFGLLYVMSTILYISCIFYEQMMRYEWRTYWFFSSCPWCQERHLGAGRRVDWQPPVSPNFVYHLLKNISLLFMGFWSGFWVWNRKMCVSWEPLFKSLKC